MKSARIIFYCLYFLSAIIAVPGCKHHEKNIKTKADPIVKNKEGVADPDTNRSKAPGWPQRLSVSAKEMKENRLYHFINDWYGVPYKYGGCQKTGVDCSCFTNLLYDKVYNKQLSRSATEIFNLCDKIGIEEAKEGDFLFFKIGGQTISHIGVFLKKQFFVHASTSKGVIINSLDEAYYKKYFYCAGKMKNG